MTDCWWLIIDYWWLIADDWLLMIDNWLLMTDCWWLIIDDRWLIADDWLLIIDYWWSMTYACTHRLHGWHGLSPKADGAWLLMSTLWHKQWANNFDLYGWNIRTQGCASRPDRATVHSPGQSVATPWGRMSQLIAPCKGNSVRLLVIRIILLPLQGVASFHFSTQGAATLCPGLCTHCPCRAFIQP